MTLWASGLMLGGVLVTGGVIDFISLDLQRKDVQRAADHAALAAAGELLSGAQAMDRVQEVASIYVSANYSREATTQAQMLSKGGGVHVRVSAPPRVFFPGPVGANAKAVTAEAVAEVRGEKQNICVIALDKDSDGAVSLDETAQINAPNCTVQSNSKRPRGLSVTGGASLKASLICSAGGKNGPLSNYSPDPLLDCPQLADPLATRPPPPVGPCDFHNMKKKDFTGEFSPGVYCNGLSISGASKVKLKPGVYVILEGDFKVDGTSEVTGDGVGFFLSGKNGRFEFTASAKVRLSAPRTGPMAGLLFMEDTTIEKETKHRITSDFVNYLVGTIYLPRGSFLIDAKQDVAEASEFTVLVVRKLELQQGPKLVLNTNYDAIDVPVPNGVGQKLPMPRLTQ